MGYNSLSESTLTGDERRAEMSRIVDRFGSSQFEAMSPQEHRFIVEMMRDRRKSVSVRQLYWGRDILAKY